MPAFRRTFLDEATSAVTVQPLGNIPEDRPYHSFEHARCRVRKALTVQEFSSCPVGFILLLTGVGRQENIHSTQAHVRWCGLTGGHP